MLSYSYAYLLGAILICMPPWVLIYFLRKDLRLEMLILGIAVAIAAPPAEKYLFIVDYWNPAFIAGGNAGIEDSVIMFFAIGVAAALGKIFLKLKYKHQKFSVKNTLLNFLIVLLIFLIGVDLGIALFMYLFKMVSIYASTLVFVILSAAILIKRRDLFKLSFVSMLLMGLFTFIGYKVLLILYPQIFQMFWHLDRVSGILVFGVPLEELLWAASFGLFIGPLYEFITNIKRV